MFFNKKKKTERVFELESIYSVMNNTVVFSNRNELTEVEIACVFQYGSSIFDPDTGEDLGILEEVIMPLYNCQVIGDKVFCDLDPTAYSYRRKLKRDMLVKIQSGR